MKFIKITALCLAAVLLSFSLFSCKKQEIDDGPSKQTVEPIPAEKQLDYTEIPALFEQVQRYMSSFSDMSPSAESDFSVEMQNGFCMISAYLGTSTEVRVPQSINGQTVTGLKKSAFENNTALKKLYLPDTVVKIEAGSLGGCETLEELRTPLVGADGTSGQFLGYLFGAPAYADNPRDVPPSLAYLEIGGEITRIADFALFDCNDLVCVRLPESVTAVGAYSFYNCKSMIAINTEGLLQVGEHAFDSCAELTRLVFNDRLTSLGGGCLQGCLKLSSLTLPFVGGSMTENTYLGYLFGATTPEFAKGYYPPYLTDITLLSTCTSMGSYAFYECESLTTLQMSENVTEVGARAFSGCVRLQSLHFSDRLCRIRENAFFGCISLEEITLGNASSSALTEIGINAFYNCSALRKVTLPQSLTALPPSCFAGCLSLEEIDLGGVRRVEKQAFRHCRSITRVTAQSDVLFEEGNEHVTSILYSE